MWARPRRDTARLMALLTIAVVYLTVTSATQHDPATAQPLETWLPVGNFGGVISAIASDGDTAWIAQGDRVSAIDVTVASQPRLLWRGAALPHPVSCMSVDERLLAAGGADGITVLDVSEPTAPRATSAVPPELSGSPFGLRGGLLYVVRDDDVHVVDVRRPGGPRLTAEGLLTVAGGVPEGLGVMNIATAGNILAVSAGCGGYYTGGNPGVLFLYDLGQPDSPAAVTRLADPVWQASGARVVGGHTLVFGVSAAGVIGLDASDPDSIVEVVRLGEDWWPRDGQPPYTVTVGPDGSPYAAYSQHHGTLEYLGIVLRIDVDGASSGFAGYMSRREFDTGVVAEADRLLVAGAEGLLVFDLGDEAARGTYPAFVEPIDVLVADEEYGARLYATCNECGVGGFRIDDSESTPPTLDVFLDSDGYRGGLAHGSGFVAAAFRGRLDIALDWIDVYDVRESDRLEHTGLSSGSISAMGTAGNALWVLSGYRDVRRYNLADRSDPPPDLRYQPDRADDMAVDGDMVALVSRDLDGTLKLQLLRYDGARQPPELATLSDTTLAASLPYADGLPLVTLSRGHAYVLAPPRDGDTRADAVVHIVDVRAPERPAERATVPVSGWPRAIDVEDGYAFVRGGDAITVLDVRNDSSPQVIGSMDEAFPRTKYPGGPPHSITVHDGTVYVASGRKGIRIYRPDLEWHAEGDPTPDVTTPPPSSSGTGTPPTPTATATPWDGEGEPLPSYLPMVLRNMERDTMPTVVAAPPTATESPTGTATPTQHSTNPTTPIPATSTPTRTAVPPPVVCPTSDPPLPPREAMMAVDTVFQGSVADVEPLGPSGDWDYRVRLDVSRYWTSEGNLGHETDVFIPQNVWQCGRPFRPGEEWLVYATTGSGDRLRVWPCDRTKPYDDAEAALLGESCVPPRLELGVAPTEVRMGEELALSIRYVGCGLPETTVSAEPGGMVEALPGAWRTESGGSSWYCDYRDDPDRCTRLALLARAPGTVTLDARAYGESSHCLKGDQHWAFGGLRSAGPVRVVIASEPLPTNTPAPTTLGGRSAGLRATYREARDPGRLHRQLDRATGILLGADAARLPGDGRPIRQRVVWPAVGGRSQASDGGWRRRGGGPTSC